MNLARPRFSSATFCDARIKGGLQFGLAIAALAATFSAQNAAAQHAAREHETADDTWRFAAGVGAFSEPKYPGSDDTRVVPIPLLRASYGRYFIGGTPAAGVPVGLGINFIQSDNWQLGLAVGTDFVRRKASDDPMLNGWGDIPVTALGSAFANYSLDWVNLRGAVTTDIAGKHQGTRVALNVEGNYSPIENLTLSAGPGITWVDRTYSQTFFGIDSAQSAVAGVPQYTSRGGINTVRFSVGAEYRLTAQWGLQGHATAARLRGDAGNSPITKNKSQNVYGVFAVYRF